MTELIYLKDSYRKTLKTKIVSVTKKGNIWHVVLKETIFYPEGGGQPADKGIIKGINGTLTVTHVRMQKGEVVHEGKLEGSFKKGGSVVAEIDWDIRFDNMRWHSAGHIMHEVTMQLVPGLVPVRGEHGKHAYIEYAGTINPKLAQTIEKQSNMLIAEGRPLHTEFVTLEELKKRASWVPPKLPENKPLRILQIQGFPPIPDGGTQVKNTSEVDSIKVTEVEQLGENVRVHYDVPPAATLGSDLDFPKGLTPKTSITLNNFRTLLLELQNELLNVISQAKPDELNELKVRYFGSHGKATLLIKRLKELPPGDRKAAGVLVNQFKASTEEAFARAKKAQTESKDTEWFDVSLPGIRPPQGHLHIVTQAIMEITRIFERIGFTRVRHPEVDWDYYAFESLNMPQDHPARDEWETFFVEYPSKPNSPSFGNNPSQPPLSKKGGEYGGKIVLTPHTSNGQVREMEKGKLPIRMINITKCYRRQSDVSHVPMFHQFEGMYIDKNVSIGHLKGFIDYFVKQFFSADRKSRLRPFHFQFTEPSFEVDISCDVCKGKGCRLCKDGWLELAGSGMIHPVVLRNGGMDPSEYSGFAIGWGIERTYMMKSGTQLDDIRLLYGNDVRFLEQF